MNHLIHTTSLPKIRQERCLLSTLVLLLRMGFTSDRFGFANLSLRNYQLTILCRENLWYHRDTSILSKREMILCCLKLIFLRKNIIVLIVLLIAIVITMIRLLFPIVMLTPRRIIMCMVYLMVPLARLIPLAKLTLHLPVHLLLLSHLLVCGWLRGTNSSAGQCLRWIRMDHGQWLH